MTDARAKAVEAAATAICERRNANDWPCNGLDFDDEMARVAITAYLATMAEAGWVMVRDAGERSHHELDSNYEWHRDEGWNACRSEMLKGSTDGQG